MKIESLSLYPGLLTVIQFEIEAESANRGGCRHTPKNPKSEETIT